MGGFLDQARTMYGDVVGPQLWEMVNSVFDWCVQGYATPRCARMRMEPWVCFPFHSVRPFLAYVRKTCKRPQTYNQVPPFCLCIVPGKLVPTPVVSSCMGTRRVR
jgi:hypothetical protein